MEEPEDFLFDDDPHEGMVACEYCEEMGDSDEMVYAGRQELFCHAECAPEFEEDEQYGTWFEQVNEEYRAGL